MIENKDKNKDKDKELKLLWAELKIIADENRLGILKYLKKKKSASVGEISDQLKISFKATSKHLLFLVKKEILFRQPDNPFVIYSLSSNSNQSKLIKSVISFL
ncbi:MAG: winged helix-turn-helix domain-containing protein [bacterium]